MATTTNGRITTEEENLALLGKAASLFSALLGKLRQGSPSADKQVEGTPQEGGATLPEAVGEGLVAVPAAAGIVDTRPAFAKVRDKGDRAHPYKQTSADTEPNRRLGADDELPDDDDYRQQQL